MRKCENESVDVYEVAGKDLADLLSRTAVTISALKEGSSFFNVTVGSGMEEPYVVTLYVHH